MKSLLLHGSLSPIFVKKFDRQIQKACRMQALQTDQKSEEVRLRSDGIPDEGKQLLMLRLKKCMSSFAKVDSGANLASGTR